MLKLLFLTSLLLSQAFAANAMTHQSSDECSPYWGAKAVLIGRVVSARRGKSKAFEYVNGVQRFLNAPVLHLRFEVEKAFTGSLSRGSSRMIDVECEACLNQGGIQQGKSYLVYAYGAGGKGSYPLAIPSSTLPKLTTQASAEIKSLEQLTAPGTIAYELNHVRAGILGGKAISKPAPAYPEAAKKARVDGTVTVVIILNTEGNVTRAEAVCGHPLLKAAVEEAAQKIKYTPTMMRGRPVTMGGLITYNFTLQ